MAMDSAQHVVVCGPDTDEQLVLRTQVETSRSRTRSRSRSHRDVICWHCGRRGHMRQRCFRRMRQHRRRQLRDVHVADTSRSAVATDTISPCALFQRLLLDIDASYHAIADRQWFSTYSAVGHDCAEVASLGSDVTGIGDVHLVFASGARLVLHDVRHVPQLAQDMISIPRLRDDGYAFMHTEHSWRIHRGSLVVARGAYSGTEFPLFPSYIRAGAVYVVALPCREVERRRVSFQDARHIEPALHSLSSQRHIESVDSSMDARQDESSVLVTDLAVEPYTEALFYDADHAFEVDSAPGAAVQDLSAPELASFMWEIDCSGAALSVLQSVSHMPLPDDADMGSGQIDDTQAIPVLSGPDDAYVAHGAEMADLFWLAEIAHISSAFGSLVYDLLVSRPDLGAAVVAFAVGVVSRTVADTGIVHGGALQVLTGYLHEVHVCSSSVAHSEWSLERIQVHARTWSEPVGVG